MTSGPFTSDTNFVAEVLNRGGLAIVPTDTVYGLAASLVYPEAIEQIYALKGRPQNKPIPILISRLDVAERFSTGLSDGARALIRAFWPGPLTIVVQATDRVPAACLSGGTTVGLRMPDHPELLSLLDACEGALAVTSANASGQPETTSATAAYAALSQLPEVVFDAGETSGGQPSTVIDTVVSPPTILRSGVINSAAILRVAGEA